MASKEMILTFLGTGAMKPSIRRGTCALGLHVPTIRGVENWLFDCGEGTYRQMAVFNKVELKCGSNNCNTRFGCNRLNRLFITHLHGDHIFGLPSIVLGVCFEKNDEELKSSTLSIYGPPGIADFLSTSLRVCESRISCFLNIYELCGVNQQCSFISSTDPNSSKIKIIPIRPSEDGSWHCITEDFGSVRAGLVSHTVTSIGYSYMESDQPGNLNADVVMPILKKNRESLSGEGLQMFTVLKRFKNGEKIVLPDNTILDPSNPVLISPTKKGRHISILGDTRNARRMGDLIRNSDVLVHESTVGPISQDTMPKEGMLRMSIDDIEQSNSEEIRTLKKKIHAMGHSTAVEACTFAREMNVKKLILNHISNRYDFLDDNHYKEAMKEFREVAVKAFGSEDVTIPEDFQSIVLEGEKREKH